jgi:single-strand DNA-binding protein
MSSLVHPNGRLTRDPELRFTSGGKAVAQFTVVTSRRFNNNGTWEDKDTSFWDCTAFGEMAENICENLKKGDSVLVSGQMRQETWEKDGQKKSAWRVLVDDVGPSIKWTKKAAGSSSSSYSDEPPF